MSGLGKRQAILDGALMLFAAKGFDGTAVPEIAAAAGVAVGTIYRYFPTKEALDGELRALWADRFADEVLQPLPANATPRAALRTYWRRMAAFARTHPSAYRYLELNGPVEGARILQAMQALADWGRREGAMKPVTAGVLQALLRGALAGLMRLAAPDSAIPPALAEEMEDCLWNAVAARG